MGAVFDLNETDWVDSMALIGACVSNDMRPVLFPRTTKSHYFWRINTISLVSPAPTKIPLEAAIPEKNELLTGDRDVNKSFDLEALFQQKFILTDFYRDTYPVIKLKDGRYITGALTYNQYKLYTVLDAEEKIGPIDVRFPALWLESFTKFAELANRSDCKIIVVPVFQVPYMLKDWKFNMVAGWNAEEIHKKNVIIAHMQRIALASIRNLFVLPIPYEGLELDPAHQYGAAPYHYAKSYFERIKKLVASNPGSVTTFVGSDEMRRASIKEEMTSWQAEVESWGQSK